MEKTLNCQKSFAHTSMSSNFKNHVDLNSTQALVNPQWETIDPTPDIHSLLFKFNNRFFQGLLNCVELEWCSNMFSCAGICYSTRNQMGSTCVIRLSEPLLKLRPRKDLVETLLHEMIHAWNFIRGITEENGGHGQNFLAKMYEINRLAGTNISVYHNFHDEVDLYKVHYWRCNGVCQKRSPYYGFVKKAENIAPSVKDKWWTRHVESCNGHFVKVKGPEMGSKADSVVPIPRPVSSSKIVQTIDLTGNSDGVNAKKTGTKKKSSISDVIVLDDSFTEISTPTRKSLHTTIRQELDDDQIIFIIDDEFDDNISQPNFTVPSPRHMYHCPICNVELVSERVNEHLDQCLGI